MDVTVEFKMPARIRKKGRWFVSWCPPLDVYSQGRTAVEAEQNLIDALTSFLVSCYERGTLEAVLRQAGFSPAIKPRVRKAVSARRSLVTVALPFVIANRPHRTMASA